MWSTEAVLRGRADLFPVFMLNLFFPFYNITYAMQEELKCSSFCFVCVGGIP